MRSLPACAPSQRADHSLRHVPGGRRSVRLRAEVRRPALVDRPPWLVVDTCRAALLPLHCLVSTHYSRLRVTHCSYETTSASRQMSAPHLPTVALVGTALPIGFDSAQPRISLHHLSWHVSTLCCSPLLGLACMSRACLVHVPIETPTRSQLEARVACREQVCHRCAAAGSCTDRSQVKSEKCVSC